MFSNVRKLFDAEIREKNVRQLRYELRGLWWDLRRPPVPDPVFIVGCSRSGTDFLGSRIQKPGTRRPALSMRWLQALLVVTF